MKHTLMGLGVLFAVGEHDEPQVCLHFPALQNPQSCPWGLAPSVHSQVEANELFPGSLGRIPAQNASVIHLLTLSTLGTLVT